MYGLTKQDKEDAKKHIWESLCNGESIDCVSENLGLDIVVCKELLTQLIEDKALEIKGKPPEHVYVEHVINQTKNINDLTKIVDSFDGIKNHGACVSAIKARAELFDRLIEKGQEFGVFKKVPERREIVAGMLVADMSRGDLQAAITDAVSGLNTLMKKYGDNDIIDIQPGELHHGPKASIIIEEKEGIATPRAKQVRAKTTKTTKAIRGRKKRKKKGK
jgi:hypothetical protein